MKVLKVVSCSDKAMWYSDMEHCFLPLLGEESSNTYWSIEPCGYKNIVKKSDVEVVEVTQVQYFTDKIIDSVPPPVTQVNEEHTAFLNNLARAMSR